MKQIRCICHDCKSDDISINAFGWGNHVCNECKQHFFVAVTENKKEGVRGLLSDWMYRLSCLSAYLFKRFLGFN